MGVGVGVVSSPLKTFEFLPKIFLSRFSNNGQNLLHLLFMINRMLLKISFNIFGDIQGDVIDFWRLMLRVQ